MSTYKLLGWLVINVVQVALSTQDSKIHYEQEYKHAKSGWNDVINRGWSWFLTFSTRGSSNRNGGRERSLRNLYIGLRGSAPKCNIWCQPFRATHQWKPLLQPCKRTEIIDVQEYERMDQIADIMGRVMRNYKKQIYIYLHRIRAPGSRKAIRTVATSNDYYIPIKKNEGNWQLWRGANVKVSIHDKLQAFVFGENRESDWSPLKQKP